MTASDVRVAPYKTAICERFLDPSIRAWDMVLEVMRDDLDCGFMSYFMYDNFYPDRWDACQRAGLALASDEETRDCDVVLTDDEIAGWVCTRTHPEDSTGEVHILCVDPAHQREGIGRALTEHAHECARRVGVRMVMVETGGDVGHTLACATYEVMGYERQPAARYLKQL